MMIFIRLRDDAAHFHNFLCCINLPENRNLEQKYSLLKEVANDWDGERCVSLLTSTGGWV